MSTVAGEAGVDDRGAVAWTVARHGMYDQPLLATDRGSVIVAETASTLDEAGRQQRTPLVVRTLDPATGRDRGRVELMPAGDHLQLEQIAVSADHRVAIRAGDMRFRITTIEGPDHQPLPAITQDSTEQLVVVDAAIHAIALPVPAAAPLGPLGPGEVVFVDRYAHGTETAGVTVVDLTSGHARYTALLRPARVAVGEGLDSFVQVRQFASDGATLSFAGLFAGDVAPLRAQVGEVDSCVAAHHLECTTGHGKVTLAPFAGFVGAVDLR